MKKCATVFAMCLVVMMAASCNSKKKTEVKKTLNTVLEQYYTAQGGMDAFNKLQTRQIEGTIAVSINGNKTKLGDYKITSFQKAPDLKYSRAITSEGKESVNGFDGKTAWAKDPDKPVRKLMGEELKASKRDAIFNGSIDIAEFYKPLEYTGEETVDGKQYDVLKGTHNDGFDATLYINDKTDLMEKMILKADGKVILVDYSGYKKTDGVKLPHSVLTTVKNKDDKGEGFKILLKMDKITHGIDIDENIFKMPSE